MAKETKKNLSDDIEENRSPGLAILFGEINEDVVRDICGWILTENLSDNPPEVLTLLINSPGGSVADAFALIEIMNGSRIPIRTVALGEVASAGLLIAMSGTKGLRTITPTCSVMSHHFSAGAVGNYHSLVGIQKEFKFADQRILNQYAKSTDLTVAEIREKLIPERDVWLSPTEALDLGLFDILSGVDATEPIDELADDDQ